MPLHSPVAVLAAALLPTLVMCISPGPARSADFTDAAGRRVVLPAEIRRILPAEPNAEVLVFVLAPDKLVGLSRLPGRSARAPRACPSSVGVPVRFLRAWPRPPGNCIPI